MRPADAVAKNLGFWNEYADILCTGLSDEQIHATPQGHENNIAFCLWHGFNSADLILHNLLISGPPVYVSGGWSQRLPLPEGAPTPFGTGWSADHVKAFRLDLEAFQQYADAVTQKLQEYAASLTVEQAAEEIDLPFFAKVYPSIVKLNRLEALTFFAVGHVAEHLGEVQYIKGLLGTRGAPL